MGTHHAYETFPDQDTLLAVRTAFPTNVAEEKHQGRTLLLPTFDQKNKVRMEPSHLFGAAHLPPNEPVIMDIGVPWDIASHATPRKPVSLGRLTQAEKASFELEIVPYAQYVLDMPIKFPGTNVRLPGELKNLAPVIQRIIDTEHELNSDYDGHYAYLSYHQGYVEPGRRQREMPAHVDGFQGVRWHEKHPANHSYLVSSALPTIFYPRAFPLDHVDLSKEDVYAEFARQIASCPDGSIWTPEDDELILMDAYCVHQGAVASTRVFRTWLQVSWETRIYDRIGNTHNCHFDYAWEMVSRDLDPRICSR